jgi:hypothetical protein
VDSTRFPNPGAGVGYTFRDSTNTRADVYVYPLSQENRALPSDSSRLAHEAALFAQVLQVRESQGAFDGVQIVIDKPLEAAQSSVPGRVVVAVWRERGASFVSFMHVFAFGETVLKVRLTLPASQWQQSTAPDFALDLVRSLAQPTR